MQKHITWKLTVYNFKYLDMAVELSWQLCGWRVTYRYCQNRAVVKHYVDIIDT